MMRESGQTRFTTRRGGALLGGVVPRLGRAIVFDHRLWHDGEPVTAGEKRDAHRRHVCPPAARACPATVGVDRESAWLGRPGWSGHQGYVFALAALPSGDLVSGSRDRSVRVTCPRN